MDVRCEIEATLQNLPELTEENRVRALLTAIGGIPRERGPAAAVIVGKTRDGQSVAMEVNLVTLVTCVEVLKSSYGIDVRTLGPDERIDGED